MNSSPLISVVMTTYNGERFLEKQMDSIIAQTYPNLEIIVVDDRSTDNTAEVLNRYALQYNNVRVILNDRNLGFVKNFEKGCSLASGKYIALCDHDDYWLPQKLTRLYEQIGTYPMIYSDSLLCNENLQPTGVRISDRAVLGPVHSPLQQAVFCRIYGHATLMTREFFQKTVPFLPVIPHDWWLCYMATLHGGITYLNEPLVYYRQHANNLFGAVGGKRRRKEKERKRDEIEKIRTRVKAFYEACPDSRAKDKKVLRALVSSYSSFSLLRDFQRMFLFFRYYPQFLYVKKRSALRKILFCFKMFAIVK